jgi:putative hydrolase
LNNFEDNQPGGAEEQPDPEQFAQFMREFLSNQSGIDPEQLAKAAGIPNSPEAIESLKKQIEAALSASELQTTGGVNWKVAAEQARELAKSHSRPISEQVRGQIFEAEALAALWLDGSTSISAVISDPKLLTRELWVADALGLFQELSQPVAERMANALTEVMQQNMPEELGGLGGGASKFMKAAGGALFAMQLGQAIGKLSLTVISGGDVGLPIFEERAALVPQNLSEFVAGLEVEPDQAYIYLITRELAFARLFKHSKWLRDSVVGQVSAYASEISIDSESLRDLAEDADLNNPEDLRRVLESGALIAARTDEQERALASIETLLALIEGWVEVVTEDATRMLPKAAAIGEAVRRRRATGGPAELTFGTLVGLELRPRRQREAAAMWRELTESVGTSKRDSLWEHPDLLPTSDEIDNPARLVSRVREAGGSDAMDQALKDLLGE